MSVEIFRTDIIVFIDDVIMGFTSDWLINLCMRVTNWPNIFVDQGQFIDPDFISGTHQRENFQLPDSCVRLVCWISGWGCQTKDFEIGICCFSS